LPKALISDKAYLTPSHCDDPSITRLSTASYPEMSLSTSLSSEPWQVLNQGSSWPIGWTVPAFKSDIKSELKAAANKSPTFDFTSSGWNTTWTAPPPPPSLKKSTIAAASPPSPSITDNIVPVSRFPDLSFSPASSGDAWQPQLISTKKKPAPIEIPTPSVVVEIESPPEEKEIDSSPSDSTPTSPLSPEDESLLNIEEELSKQSLYKTELCRSFAETANCRYGHKCQFAHGEHEVRPILRHPKYKTENCKTFVATGTCPYGPRCRFIHPVAASAGRPTQKWLNSWGNPSTSGSPTADQTGDEAKDLDDGSRLAIFKKLAI